MSLLELNDEQVISILRQLPAARKRTACWPSRRTLKLAARKGCGLASHSCAARAPSVDWTGIASRKTSAKRSG